MSRKFFSLEEENFICNYLINTDNNPDYKLLAQHMGRTVWSVRKKVSQLRKSIIPFTKEEDEMILSLVQPYLDANLKIDWHKISKHFVKPKRNSNTILLEYKKLLKKQMGGIINDINITFPDQASNAEVQDSWETVVANLLI